MPDLSIEELVLKTLQAGQGPLDMLDHVGVLKHHGRFLIGTQPGGVIPNGEKRSGRGSRWSSVAGDISPRDNEIWRMFFWCHWLDVRHEPSV